MRDYSTYFNLMSANLKEKADFIIKELDNERYDIVYDFGCANGDLTRLLAEQFPNIKFIGIEVNEEVRKINQKENIFNNIYYNRNMSEFTKNTMVIFSSVLHEIFSFMEENEIIKLLNQCRQAKSILIRDMLFTDTELINSYETNEHENYVNQFFNGLKQTNQTFAHFLMKVRYKINWFEELKEDYFATDWDLILDMFKNDYTIKEHNYYINEYLAKEIPDLEKYTKTTHIKLLLRRKD